MPCLRCVFRALGTATLGYTYHCQSGIAQARDSMCVKSAALLNQVQHLPVGLPNLAYLGSNKLAVRRLKALAILAHIPV